MKFVPVVIDQLCYLALNFATKFSSTAESSDNDKTYVLPDENFTTVGGERFRFAEGHREHHAAFCWVVHSSAIKDVLVLLNEVCLPGAHVPFFQSFNPDTGALLDTRGLNSTCVMSLVECGHSGNFLFSCFSGVSRR